MPKATGMRWAAAVLGLVVLGSLLNAAPAYGHQSKTFDWRIGFHEICRTCPVRHGNLVAFWQAILWADDPQNIGESCESFVDGDFGPKTEAATRRTQQRYHLQVDGRVGPQTWGPYYQFWIAPVGPLVYDGRRYWYVVGGYGGIRPGAIAGWSPVDGWTFYADRRRLDGGTTRTTLTSGRTPASSERVRT